MSGENLRPNLPHRPIDITFLFFKIKRMADSSDGYYLTYKIIISNLTPSSFILGEPERKLENNNQQNFEEINGKI